MRQSLLFALALFTSSAHACPNLSGQYEFSEQAGYGKIIVKQKACESILLRLERKVTPSPEIPDGNWAFTLQYKTDGRAYGGMYESQKLAGATDTVFHITSFTEGGVAMVDYTGAQEKCGLNHTFNDVTGGCKKIERRLDFDQELNAFVWRQIGNVWWADGWSDEVFPLRKL